jgi:putative nucleotidyltransferase with HDIG domain
LNTITAQNTGLLVESTVQIVEVATLEAAYRSHENVSTQLPDFEAYCLALNSRDAGVFAAISEDYRQRCHQAGFVLGEVVALRWSGKAHHRLGDNKQALTRFFEGLQLASQLDNHPVTRVLLLSIGIVYYEIGDCPSATDFIERSLVIARTTGNTDGLCRGIFVLGLVEFKLEQLESAMQHFQEAERLATLPKSRDMIGWSLTQQGRVHHILALRQPEAAQRQLLLRQGLEQCQVALAIAQKLGDITLEIEVESAKVVLLRDLGQAEAALTSQQRVIELSELLGSEHYLAETLIETLSLVKSAQAIANAERALAIAKQIGNQTLMARVYQALAQQLKAEGRYLEALQYFEEHILLDKAVRSAQATAQATAAVVRLESERIRARADELEHLVSERTKELEQSRFDMLERLASIAEFRDENTSHHMTRVSAVAVAIARVMGCDQQQLQYLYVAAKLHDIGKIAVPDQILFKQGKLTPGEWAMMQIHTNLGAKMLSGDAPILQMASEIALSHHERFDGTGYPQQLRGEDIPLWGRIVAVADVFDALQSERPYKTAWSKLDAIAEIKVQSGKMFDPRIVKIFLAVING